MFTLALLAVSVAAVPESPKADNAWAEWSRWEDFMGALDSPALELVNDLNPESPIRKETLDQAREILGPLDLSLEKLRRGLRLPACERSKGDSMHVLRIADAVLVRSLLAVEDRQDPSPMILDLLSTARRVARCAEAGLVGLTLGMRLEQRARTLAEWSASFGLLPAQSRARLEAAFAAHPLSPQDVVHAISQEEAMALGNLLPAMPRAENFYSRQATEALLVEKFKRLRTAVNPPGIDVAKFEEDLKTLVTVEERAVLRDWQELVNQGLPPEKLAAIYRLKDDKEGFARELKEAQQTIPKEKIEALLQRGIPPNGLGRLLVQISVGGMIQPMMKAAEELRVAKKLRFRARARSNAWLLAGEPAAEMAGRCVRISASVYRLDAAAQKAVEESGAEPIFRAVRIVPELRDGGAYGMKVSGFTASSFAGSCGFEPNDVIQSVNGYPVTRPDQALSVFASVKESRKAALVVHRGGRELTIVVHGAE